MLDEFEGYLQTDGYVIYNHYHKKEKVIHLACWVHARRYFEKALEQDKVRAEFALLKIQEIYALLESGKSTGKLVVKWDAEFQ